MLCVWIKYLTAGSLTLIAENLKKNKDKVPTTCERRKLDKILLTAFDHTYFVQGERFFVVFWPH